MEQNTATESLHNLQNLTDAQKTDLDFPASQQSSEASREERRVEDTESPLPEHSRTLDDSTLKSRAKRESRRKRELEQATFSLELLKVRSNNVPISDQPVASTDNMGSSDVVPIHSSPQSSLDSHCSFELLSVDDVELEETDLYHHPDPSLINPSITVGLNESDDKMVPESKKTPVRNLEPSSPVQTGPKTSKPLFYIPDEGSSPVRSAPQTPSKSKPEKKESVVFLISMQKESPIDQCSQEALERLEQEAECHLSSAQQESISSGMQLGQASLNHPPVSPSQAPLVPCLGLSAETTTLPAEKSAREVAPEPRTEGSMIKMQAQKKAVTHSISISMKEKASDRAFSPKRSRLTFSK